MKRLRLAVIIATLLLVTLPAVWSHPVRADSSDPITFTDSAVTIYSPVNTTYSGGNLVLNLCLYSAGNMGSLDPNISMNYSIDGKYNGSVPLRSNGEIHIITQAVATVGLPTLPDGAHCLTLYQYGLNHRTYEPKYLSYINTVYFSTASANSAPSPTLKPTLPPTPSATPTPSPSPTSAPTLKQDSLQPNVSSSIPSPTQISTPNPTQTSTADPAISPLFALSIAALVTGGLSATIYILKKLDKKPARD